MNEKQKANLRLLAGYLKDLDPKVFNMEYFRANKIGEETFYINKNNWGTVGCALGWAPNVKGLEAVDSDFSYDIDGIFGLNYRAYCSRVFGLDGNTDKWYWCFASIWVETDNTPTGAAKRIITLLEDKMPKNW